MSRYESGAKKVPHLRTVREVRGVGLRQLARETGISHKTLVQLEHGRTGAYRPTLAKLVEHLDCYEWELTGLHSWALTDQEREHINELLTTREPQKFFLDEGGDE